MQLSSRTILGAFFVFCALVSVALFSTHHTKQDVTSPTALGTAFAETPAEADSKKPDNVHQQDLATQIKVLHKSGEFDKALEISKRVLKSDPPDLEAYDARWRLIAKMFSEVDTKKRIHSEIETLLRTHPETPEVLEAAHWGYRDLPGGVKNVPNSLFDKMLQYPKTELHLLALLGFAERSEDASQKWHYYQRVIDEFTASDVPELSWYLLAYEEMMWLAEEDRSLVSDAKLDELINRYLKAHLFYCQKTQRWSGWAHTIVSKWRLKLNIRLDKALEDLARAEIRLGEAEEQTWIKRRGGSIEERQKDISRLRAEIYLQQERWREAHDGLLANAPDFSESLWVRFNEHAINYFWMLGQSAERIGEWETARRYYADAYFAPKPHVEARAGLERVYHQTTRGETADTFEAFLKDTEAEYRIRETADLEKFRQEFITKRLNKKATDFRLETLEGETYSLSAMAGKVVLLDVSASWCGPCIGVMPEVKLVYKHFSKNDDVVVLGINDGETPEQVRKFLDEHEQPWPVLLDQHQKVRKAYQFKGIPFFILIDKAGNWQYSFLGSHLINGQPLIWMIEALLSD
ncbi:MAG: TlpA disulfide reductase family protein [Candidatus Poribacteria bacterium]|nr:TlpA disulfide reductase family protein [Candidatus Poribacteria bacterium]